MCISETSNYWNECRPINRNHHNNIHHAFGSPKIKPQVSFFSLHTISFVIQHFCQSNTNPQLRWSLPLNPPSIFVPRARKSQKLNQQTFGLVHWQSSNIQAHSILSPSPFLYPHKSFLSTLRSSRLGTNTWSPTLGPPQGTKVKTGNPWLSMLFIWLSA